MELHKTSVIVALLATVLPQALLYDCPSLPCSCRKDREQDNGRGGYTVHCYGNYRSNGTAIIVEEDSILDSPFPKPSFKQYIVKNATDFTNINDQTFEGMEIHTLKLTNISVTIEPSTFVALKTSLRNLSLINVDAVKSWNLNFLKGLTELNSLTLDWNNGDFLLDFRANVFKDHDLQSLTALSLRHCEIAKMSENSLAGLPNLEILDLSYNKLSSTPKTILLLKNLKKLIMTNNNKLYYINDRAFYGLSNLREINLDHSILNRVSLCAFCGLEDCLERLILGHADLLDGHFSSMQNLNKLKQLDISYNKIIEMHNKSFEGFKVLEELDISGQFYIQNGIIIRGLPFIDSMFRGVDRTLKVLRISDLGLISLPLNALQSLKYLKELDASFNDFPELYESFFDGIHALTINLTSCGIGDISSSAFETLSEGTRLIFDSNNITNISFILDTDACQFQSLSFLDNPIVCGCDVVEIAATQRVDDLRGNCSDDIYRNVELKHLNKVELTSDICDTELFKPGPKCFLSSGGCNSFPDGSLCSMIAVIIAALKSVI